MINTRRPGVPPRGLSWDQLFSFFPTCQVRVVRFSVSCLLLPPHASCLLPPRRPLPPPASCRLLPPAASCLVLLLFVVLVVLVVRVVLVQLDPRSTVFAAGPQPRPSTPSVPCWTSTTTIPAQCSLPDLNRDHPRPVFPAGPQPRPSPPSVPCRTSTGVSRPSVPCRTSCRKIWDKENARRYAR